MNNFQKIENRTNELMASNNLSKDEAKKIATKEIAGSFLVKIGYTITDVTPKGYGSND